MARALNIFTEAQKEKFEIKAIAQMAADVNATVGKNLYDLLLKKLELKNVKTRIKVFVFSK